jgi:pimeloyl-ACP methyl ester carboxylesterase
MLQQPDLDLQYEQAGQGPPVLLIQGVGVTGEGWRPQVNVLQARFQTLTFDNRGIGKSQPCRGPISIEAMAQDCRALLDAAGWESAHVVGHSMGGVVAQQLALDCPKRVRSLALLCTFARGKDAARLTPWVLWMTLRTRVGSRQMRRHAFLEMLWSKEELQTADLDDLAHRVASLIGRDLADQPPILMKQLFAMGRHDCLARLGELSSIPTLVVSADSDRIALPRYGQLLAQSIPGARYEEIGGASHGVTIQKAEHINQLLEGFIRSVEAARE